MDIRKTGIRHFFSCKYRQCRSDWNLSLIHISASQKKMRDFAKENHIDFWEGKGVCHQVMMENYVRPGELIFGADSHTCSYGALGAFGTGVGCTDFLYGMVTGTSWVLVPETVKFNLIGKLPEGVYARDLILTIIGEIGANGCNYQVMEFTGEGAKTLSISDRMAVSYTHLDVYKRQAYG